MVVQHNIQAQNSNRQLNITSGKLQGNSEKLSSGYKINKSADDAAGLAISEKMRKQIRGLDQASQNAEEGISLIQTAEGALGEVHDMLHRMNELAIQSANGTNSDIDRQCIQDEIVQLKKEIDRVSTSTKYNEIYLLDGHLADPSRVGEARKKYNKAMEEAIKHISSINEDNIKDLLSPQATLHRLDANAKATGAPLSLDDMAGLEGIKIFYIEETDEVDTVQTHNSGGSATTSGFDNLKNQLKTQIVPQAVKALLNTYPDTFGYLAGSSIGIGLKLEYNSSSSTMASVTIGGATQTVGGVTSAAYLTYKLTVNRAYVTLNGDGTISDASRDSFENTIVHEMTHALMDEVLTNGMLGYVDGSGFSEAAQFPKWFKEGMAQTAAGAYYDGNDWINGAFGFNSTTSDSTIKTVLSNYPLSRSSESNDIGSKASYGTGYLACMYLGYLMDGGTSVNPSNVARGLDKLLNTIKNGKSLDAVIRENTSYSGIADFQSKFGDTASVDFIKKLTVAVGGGAGGLVTGNYADNDLLSNDPLSDIKLFQLDTTFDTIRNVYPTGYEVLAGGAAYADGAAGPSGGGGTPGGGGGGTPGGGGGGTPGGGGGTPGGGGITPGGGGITPGPIPFPEYTDTNVSNGLQLQVGADSDDSNQMILYIEGMGTKQICVDQVDVSTQEGATIAIDMIAFGISQVSAQRSLLGAYQNRLEHTIKNLDNVSENTQAAESKLRDTDMAKEMVAYSNNKILQQAGQSMLTQANQANQGVLSLIQ